MKSNKWLPIAVTLCIIALGTPTGLITIYHYANPQPFVSPSFPWGEYGSLYAGIFTLAATALSLATLIYLVSFNRDMQKENRAFIEKQSVLISRQMELSELEQYTRHKELFNERLNHIEKRFEHKFEFTDPFQLYRTVFPNNKIGRTSITHEITAESKSLTDLQYAVDLYQRIAEQIKTHHDTSDSDFIKIPINLYQLQEHLQIRYDQHSKVPGDICLRDFRTGMNCFIIKKTITECTYILNELLEFSGNTPIEDCNKQTDCSLVQERLLDYVLNRHPHKVLNIYDPLGSIKAFYNIRNQSEKLKTHPELADINDLWGNLTDSMDKIISLGSKKTCNKLGEYLQGEIQGFSCTDQATRDQYFEIQKNVDYLIKLN